MIVLVGASASGKTEIAKKLVSSYGFSKVVTYTTRNKRPNEKIGVDYHFVSEKSFLDKKKKGFFLETTLYNGNYYGTSYDELGINKVLIVDPNGLKSYSDLHDKSIISF
jgi:guanylate kinase